MPKFKVAWKGSFEDRVQRPKEDFWMGGKGK